MLLPIRSCVRMDLDGPQDEGLSDTVLQTLFELLQARYFHARVGRWFQIREMCTWQFFPAIGQIEGRRA